MTRADDVHALRQRYVAAVIALSDATAVITGHARAGTAATEVELQQEDDARVIFAGVSRDYYATSDFE